MEEVETGELIPGLPDHVAMLCLMRVPWLHHSSLRAVCKGWNTVLRSQSFYHFRRKIGQADAWLFVLCNGVAASPLATCFIYDLRTRQLMCKVPLPPSKLTCVDGYRLAGVDGCVLLLGLAGKKGLFGPGAAQECEDAIHIFDTVTHRWRQGPPMTVPRIDFGSGVMDGRFYVAGGYTRNGHAEVCTEVYDVHKDEWKRVCDMPLTLDTIECDAVFRGKLYVRGFQMETQQVVILVYDPVADSWQRDVPMGTNSRLENGELVATDSGLFNLTLRDKLQKYDFGEQEWRNVGDAANPSTDAFNIHAQRAFGHKGHIFLLAGEMASPPRHLDNVVVHSLFLGSSWYRSGALLQA